MAQNTDEKQVTVKLYISKWMLHPFQLVAGNGWSNISHSKHNTIIFMKMITLMTSKAGVGGGVVWSDRESFTLPGYMVIYRCYRKMVITAGQSGSSCADYIAAMPAGTQAVAVTDLRRWRLALVWLSLQWHCVSSLAQLSRIIHSHATGSYWLHCYLLTLEFISQFDWIYNFMSLFCKVM